MKRRQTYEVTEEEDVELIEVDDEALLELCDAELFRDTLELEELVDDVVGFEEVLEEDDVEALELVDDTKDDLKTLSRCFARRLRERKRILTSLS